MRVYISGPITGMPDNNFPAFNAAAKALRELGFEVVNPAEINPEGDKTWQECMRADIPELCTCQALVLLPGWERSQGAHLELQLAHRLGMSIKTLEQLLPEDQGLHALVERLQALERTQDYGEANWPPVTWRELSMLLAELRRLQGLNLGLLSTAGQLSQMLSESAAQAKVLRAALEEAEAGLVFAGAVDHGQENGFVPSPVLALRAVRKALAPI